MVIYLFQTNPPTKIIIKFGQCIPEHTYIHSTYVYMYVYKYIYIRHLLGEIMKLTRHKDLVYQNLRKEGKSGTISQTSSSAFPFDPLADSRDALDELRS